MVRYLLLCLALSVSAIGYGKYVTFVTTDNLPIADVRCIAYSANNDSIASWLSDSHGSVDIQNKDIHYIIASRSGFSDRIIYGSRLTADRNTIVMSPGVELSEVVVKPSDVTEFATHTSYRISEKEMSRYPNVLQSLNEIPNLTVLSNGSLFFEGNQNIKILIDGVDATTQEIQTLSKEDIAKVDVYQTPPVRFIAQGISSVIDIRLKSKIHGGNGALDVTQAFKPLKGNNSAALYYNYRQSRFSLLYNNENRHFRKYRQSEVLDYDFDGVNYKKVKEGLDSKNHYDDNNLNLSYQINKPANFLYNIKTGLSVNRDGGTSNQKVTTGSESFLATNLLRTGHTRYNIRNYFEKNLGENVGSILANVNYQHFSNSYHSAYNEQSDYEGALNNSRSNYKTRLDAVFSEMQYQFPDCKLGYFSISAYETYKHSKYVDTANPFYQTTNVLGGMAQWMGRKGTLRWYLTLGMDWYHTSSALLSKSHDLYLPSPLVNINWRPARRIQFSFDYSYTGNVPTIAQLSETNQWLDTKLVYHGNPTLKPYKTHSVGIRFVWNNKYLNLSLKNTFESSPDMICDMYTLTDEYMLQTFVNLSKYREWSSQMDISLKPLGNNKLVFWNRVIFAHLKGKNEEYSWNGNRFQWMSALTMNLEHWTAELSYQYPGKIVQGQLERPRGQSWGATLLYRPMTNLSVGLDWFMPFGKGFKDSEHTVNSAPVYADTEYMIRDWSNMLSIKVSYNFNFGRNKNRATPQYDNLDNDSGILHK